MKEWEKYKSGLQRVWGSQSKEYMLELREERHQRLVHEALCRAWQERVYSEPWEIILHLQAVLTISLNFRKNIIIAVQEMDFQSERIHKDWNWGDQLEETIAVSR